MIVVAPEPRRTAWRRPRLSHRFESCALYVCFPRLVGDACDCRLSGPDFQHRRLGAEMQEADVGRSTTFGGSHDIPAEYIPEIKSILEPRARRDYEFDIQSWPERVKEREGYVAKARVLREKVPPAIELLRASCEPDPDGAHRPIYLGLVGIEATACLDCQWFTHDSWGGVEGGSRISNHRSLHWNPPHDELCHMSIVDGLTQHRGGYLPRPNTRPSSFRECAPTSVADNRGGNARCSPIPTHGSGRDVPP
jgi:hypothetical protein